MGLEAIIELVRTAALSGRPRPRQPAGLPALAAQMLVLMVGFDQQSDW